jgi:hypothetical protein
MLQRLEAAAMRQPYAPEPASRDADLPPLQPGITEVQPGSGQENSPVAAAMKPSPFRKVQGAPIH